MSNTVIHNNQEKDKCLCIQCECQRSRLAYDRKEIPDYKKICEKCKKVVYSKTLVFYTCLECSKMNCEKCKKDVDSREWYRGKCSECRMTNCTHCNKTFASSSGYESICSECKNIKNLLFKGKKLDQNLVIEGYCLKITYSLTKYLDPEWEEEKRVLPVLKIFKKEDFDLDNEILHLDNPKLKYYEFKVEDDDRRDILYNIEKVKLIKSLRDKLPE